MATPKDSKIEQCLRRIVREAVTKKEGDITVKKVRARAEAELKLEDGFFKDNEEWKERSKDVIHATFAEEPETPDPAATKTTVEAHTPSTPTPASKPAKEPRPNKSSRKSTTSSEEAHLSCSKPQSPPAVQSKRHEKEEDGESDNSSSEGEAENQVDDVERAAKPREKSAANGSERTPTQISGVKRKASEQNASDQHSDKDEKTSDEGAEDTGGPQKKKAKTDSSTSSEEDHSEDESDEESKVEGEGAEKPVSPQRQAESSEKTLLDPIPPKPFRPPSGFTVVDFGLFTDNTAFSQPNLNGKQVWRITAPSNVSLSFITELALDAIQSDQPVLTHNGVKYVLNKNLDQDSNDATVMTPTKDGYKRVEQAGERTLQLQQKLTLPNVSIRQASQVAGSSAAADIAQASVSGVRPQPKGLRMRYRPPGFGTGKPGMIGSGSESADEDDEVTAGSSFQFPKARGAHGTSIQQPADVEMADVGTDRSLKEPKKKRKDKDHDDSPALKVNGITGASSDSPAASKRSRESLSLDVSKATPAKGGVEGIPRSQINGTSAETLSKEERQKLKREKREAKRKAKEAAS